MAATITAVVAKKSKGMNISDMAKAAMKNWVLTLLVFLCTLSGIFVFMEVLADARGMVMGL